MIAIQGATTGYIIDGADKVIQPSAAPAGNGEVSIGIGFSPLTGRQVVRIDTEDHAEYELLINGKTLNELTRGYVLIVRNPGSANDISEDGNVITVDIDLGNALDGTPGDDEALNFFECLAGQLDDIPASSYLLGAAIDMYAEAVADYPNATAVVEAYRITRQGSPRLMSALHDGDGFPVLDGICSTCLTGEKSITELAYLAEAQGDQIDFDPHQSELHDAIDVLISCGLCGYQHRPDTRPGGHDISTDRIIAVNLPESHWREVILALNLSAAELTPDSPHQAATHDGAVQR
jgi:hypothetical protein